MKKLSHLLHVNSKIIALLVCVLFIQLPGGSCFAQSSTTKIKISGSVVDSDGPMIGVTVRVQNTGIGTATDNFGKFTLNNVASDANIEFSYLGYEAQVLPAKDVNGKEIVMQLEVNKLKDVVVTAQAIGQKNAIFKQINSNTIKNVISAEKLQQNPDVNTIEAIGRLPGISVTRVGGEGAGFLLRGLDEAYSKVLINGEPLPVSLGTISTYSLQGVEVFKSLTANQEGNAVAGSVDLTLRETPKGLHYSIIAQTGYNRQNNDFGNYNFVGQVSNRFFDDKLGFFLSLNADRVNRSTSLMNAGYNTNYTTNLNDPFYINAINLSLNKRINYKQSAVLTLDYIASPSTLLNFQTFASTSNSNVSTQSKSFNPEGGAATVPIYVNMNETPVSRNFGITNNLNGKTKFGFLNSILQYGVSYSYNRSKNPGTRSWAYSSSTRADGLKRDDLKVFSPAEVANSFESILNNLSGTKLESMNEDRTETSNWSITPRIDYEVPFETDNGWLKGNIKIGAKYRYSRNKVDRTYSHAYAGSNALFSDFVKDKYGYSSGYVELQTDGQEKNFLGGDYIFGDKYSFDRSNQVFDDWKQNGKDKFLSGATGGLSDDPRYSGFVYDLEGSAMGDRNDKNHYAAVYIMPEINLGKWLMVIPGLRFEYTRSDMKAYKGNEVTRFYSVYEDMKSAFGLRDTTHIRTDRFLLPMIHVRVKPTNWFYIHYSYTHTVRRPSDGVAPFEFYSTQDPSNYRYSAGNSDLKTELWRSHDLQFTFHGGKLGLFSVTGFLKSVDNKLWSRAYTRIKGDPIPDPIFKDNDLVKMTVYENHPYNITLKGFEVEWQSSFGYLPKPLSYLTLSANYTYTFGKSPNPYTRLYKYKPEGSRYEVTGRQDSVVIEPMTGMPKHMVNVTLGVEVKAFKCYLSYQFTSDKIQTTHPNDLRLYIMNEPYSRLDFNASYGFDLKSKGLIEILLKVGNLTNSEDRIRYRGESRPITVEQYGVTADLGIKYRF